MKKKARSVRSSLLNPKQMLVNYVQSIVVQSGDGQDFDADKWLIKWMNTPIPALGFETPMTCFNTDKGVELLLNFLAISQSGAYA